MNAVAKEQRRVFLHVVGQLEELVMQQQRQAAADRRRPSAPGKASSESATTAAASKCRGNPPAGFDHALFAQRHGRKLDDRRFRVRSAAASDDENSNRR